MGLLCNTFCNPRYRPTLSSTDAETAQHVSHWNPYRREFDGLQTVAASPALWGIHDALIGRHTDGAKGRGDVGRWFLVLCDRSELENRCDNMLVLILAALIKNI